MRLFRSATLLCLLLPLAPLSATAAEPELPDSVLARVDGAEITRAEVERLIASSPVSGIDLATAGGKRTLRELTTALIQRRLLEEEAEASGLTADPDYRKAIADFERGVAKDPHRDELVAEYRRTKLVVLQRQRLEDRFRPTEAELRGYFEAHRDRYDIPEEANVQQIVVATEAEAQRLAKEARGGADFSGLAVQHSTDPFVKRNFGMLGWVKRGEGFPALDELVFTLKRKGEIGGPVQSPRGYHVVKLIDHRDGRTVSFEEARKRVEADMVKERLNAHLLELAKKAKITVNKAAFQ